MTGRWTYPKHPHPRRCPRRPAWRRLLRRKSVQKALTALTLIAVLAIAQGIASPPATESAAQEPEAVQVRVIDGDTVEIRASGERIRLENIDTPETGDRARCTAERQAGERATSEARRLINNSTRVSVRRSDEPTDMVERSDGSLLTDAI